MQLQSAYAVIPIVEVYAHTACVDLFTADETSDGIVTVDIRGAVSHIGMRIQRAVGIVDEGVAQDVIVPNGAHPSQLVIRVGDYGAVGIGGGGQKTGRAVVLIRGKGRGGIPDGERGHIPEAVVGHGIALTAAYDLIQISLGIVNVLYAPFITVAHAVLILIREQIGKPSAHIIQIGLPTVIGIGDIVEQSARGVVIVLHRIAVGIGDRGGIVPVIGICGGSGDHHTVLRIRDHRSADIAVTVVGVGHLFLSLPVKLF